MQKQKLLIFFPGFDTKRFFASENRDEWETLYVVDFTKYGIRMMLNVLRVKKDIFVMGRSNLRDQKVRFPAETVMLLARAKKKFFIDNSGRIVSISINRYLFRIVPHFLIELMIAPFLIGVTYVLLGAWNIYLLRSKKQRVFLYTNEKKVLFFRTEYLGSIKAGGSFTHIEGFTNGLQKLGYRVHFAGPQKPLPNLIEAEMPFTRIPYPTFFHDIPELPEIAYNFILFWKALFLIRREKPAFVYQRHGPFHAAVAIAVHLCGIPFILESNGSEVWARRHWGKLYLSHLARLFEHTAFKTADLITVVSDVAGRDLEKLGISSEKIVLNPNGVDPSMFHPGIDGEGVRVKYKLGDNVIAGFIGTFYRFHGVEVLARAIPKVVAANQSVSFLLIGEGPLKSHVEEYVCSRGGNARTVFTGMIDHSKAPSYLASCDILIAPHIPNEDGSRFFGSPTKLFEYMAMGKAIVASDLEQIGEVLEHEKTALLVKPGDVDELAKAIVRLANDKALRERLGKAAREAVVKKYTWEMNAKRVVEAYEAFVEGLSA